MAFRGTSLSQNSKFGDKQAKLLKTTKFPSIYAQPVDTAKVNVDVMRDWTTGRLVELLGFDDDIVTEMVFEYLDQPSPDPKVLHINLLGFLEEKTTAFMKDLWSTLLSAMKEESGVPRKILEDKINKLKEHVQEERLPSSLARAPIPPTRQPEPHVADIQRNVSVRPLQAPARSAMDQPLESRHRERSPPSRHQRPRTRSRSPPPARYPSTYDDRNRDAPLARRDWSRSRSRSRFRSSGYRRRRVSPSPSPPQYAHDQRRGRGYSRSHSRSRSPAYPRPHGGRGRDRDRSLSASPVYYQDTRRRSPSPAYYPDTRGGRSRSRSPYQVRRRSRGRSRGRPESRSPPPTAGPSDGVGVGDVGGWAGRLTEDEIRRRQQRSPSWSSSSTDHGPGSPETEAAVRESRQGRSVSPARSRSLSREREPGRRRDWSRSPSRDRPRDRRYRRE